MLDVPKLPGWFTFPECAEVLGVTKQAIHKMAFENNEFSTLKAVGSKPVYVVSEKELEKVRKRREAEAADREERRAEREARLEERRTKRALASAE